MKFLKLRVGGASLYINTVYIQSITPDVDSDGNDICYVSLGDGEYEVQGNAKELVEEIENDD